MLRLPHRPASRVSERGFSVPRCANEVVFLVVASNRDVRSARQWRSRSTTAPSPAPPTYYPRGDFWNIIRGTTAPTPIIYNINSDGLANVTALPKTVPFSAPSTPGWPVTCDRGAPNLIIQRRRRHPNRDTRPVAKREHRL